MSFFPIIDMKKKILVVGPTPPPYHGCSVMNEMLFQSDLIRQFNIKFLDTSDRRGITNIGTLDLTNIFLALFHGIKFVYFLLRYNPDLVYISISQVLMGYLRDLLFLIPARLINKKILIHLHGGAFHEFYKSMPSLLIKLTRYIFKGRVWGIVLGDNLKFCFDGLIESPRIYCVPNGIKDMSFRKESHKAENGTIRLLYLANLMKSKGFMDLLKIIPEAVRQHSNLVFAFAGEKIDYAEMEKANALIANYKLEQHVKMLGVVKGQEKEKLLAESDIFVFPPIAPEGQPLVILEAMSAGLPIITTDQGAIRETVVDGINGFIIPPGKPEVIVEKILLLARDQKLRAQMGLSSREIFVKNYTLDRWANNIADLFQEVLKEN